VKTNVWTPRNLIEENRWKRALFGGGGESGHTLPLPQVHQHSCVLMSEYTFS
jgi:hypothetical protein